jgi:hypothetical protein
MANQAQVTKSVAHVMTGSSGAASASKVVAYMILTPGDIVADDSNRQGHVYSKIIVRS